MKARVKETGKIEEILSVNTTWNNFMPMDEVEFIQDETPEDIDWKAYRLELIKAALQGFCANTVFNINSAKFIVADTVIKQADAVIEKLKDK